MMDTKLPRVIVIMMMITLTQMIHAPGLFAATSITQGNAGYMPGASSLAMAGCTTPTSSAELNVNNVRTTIMNAGDMWWNLSESKYEIPKGSGKNSFFMGTIWMGGVDQANQLRFAGQQGGSLTGRTDFWAGPLDANGNVDEQTCHAWDKHFSVYKTDVLHVKNGGAPDASVSAWPGMYAPFMDKNGNGVYEPASGDYPLYETTRSDLIPDQMIWYVMNDKGNTHTQFPGAEPMSMEIQATAFAFVAPGHLNNTTMYRYRLINKSTNVFNNFYFGLYTDADLGDASDDYIGCDLGLVDYDGAGPNPAVPRYLAYTYNSDNEDGTAAGYGISPPAAGIKFLKTLKDTNNEEAIPLLLYCGKNGPATVSEPSSAVEAYRYLRGLWADGTAFTYGGTGYNPGSTDYFNFTFPASTAPGRAAWSEISENNIPGDRRTIQSAGPVTFSPGQVQEVVVAALWARSGSGGTNITAIEDLKAASDEVQIAFNNGFSAFLVGGIGAQKKNEVRIYPNPVQENAMISWPAGTAQEIYTLSVFSMDGKLVKRITGLRGGSYELNRQGLESGAYLLRVQSSHEKMSTKMMIY